MAHPFKRSCLRKARQRAAGAWKWAKNACGEEQAYLTNIFTNKRSTPAWPSLHSTFDLFFLYEQNYVTVEMRPLSLPGRCSLGQALPFARDYCLNLAFSLHLAPQLHRACLCLCRPLFLTDPSCPGFPAFKNFIHSLRPGASSSQNQLSSSISLPSLHSPILLQKAE